MKIAYETKRFQGKTQALIVQADVIIEEYQKQGYSLTLRQLFYQFVSRGFIPNTEKSYTNLGNIINDARLCGLIDWNAIEDRTRNLQSLSTWESPSEILETAAKTYRIDKWKEQMYAVEVWIEKEALLGVIAGVCESLEIPYFACRGYVSASEMWRAGQRILDYNENGQKTIIIHLGDHDPSGIDMTRDIEDRLETFTADLCTEDIFLVERIALTIEQVRQFNPPPNPAKFTDTRFETYVEKYGRECWELDALDPSVLNDLIAGTVLKYRDEQKWSTALEQQEVERKVLNDLSGKIRRD